MDMKSVILLARPWPKELTRNFMQSDIAFFLKKMESIFHLLKFRYFENLTGDNKETVFKVKVNDLENRIQLSFCYDI